jgi:translation initiation factor IF-3
MLPFLFRRILIFKPRGRFQKREIARINHQIRVPEVRLIASDGEQLGVKPTGEAIKIAREEGLDLVEIAPKAAPPVARIMDYGKFKYEQEQKAKRARKRQHIIEVKEIKFRPKIGTGDYETKKRHVERFLQAGSKVKITIMFRGREMAHPELGRQILDRLSEDVAEFSVVEQPPKRDGRNMVMILNSTVKKPEEKEEKKQSAISNQPSAKEDKKEKEEEKAERPLTEEKKLAKPKKQEPEKEQKNVGRAPRARREKQEANDAEKEDT